MMQKAFVWAWYRFRPDEGWLSFFLLLGAVICLTAAVAAVEWVPQGNIVLFTGGLGLLLGTIVAKRPLRAIFAWLLILAYGLLATAIYVGQLLPPLTALLQGEAAATFRQSWALFVDRMVSWFVAVSSSGSSSETIVFAFGLGLLTWLLAAYAGWTTYRQRRPLLALGLLGLALAVNGYYGGDDAPIWLVALFIAFTTLLAAAMHFANMEKEWQQRLVDYSGEVRFELLAAAGAVAMMLLVLAFILPTIRLSSIARAFREWQTVQEAEETLDRAFGGVRQPQPPSAAPAFRPGGGGVLPRSFLLGDAPSLYETVMMTATLSPPSSAATHWRAASYDVYTGRGWALSRERQETVPARETIALPSLAGQTLFTQTVHWLHDNRKTLYTVGKPLQFSETSTVYWRGLEDFSRALREEQESAANPGHSYQAVSRLTTAGPAELRSASLAELPPLIIARYTNLPETVSQEVRDLAQEVAGDQPTPYDQAYALQSFLRQYPYSLEVQGPPPGRDPVEYFLFQLQSGYCDYYASAMAVMARSLGLPARMATGYLAQPPDENGVQTIYQIQAHSWTEIYFAGYGWVEFEPTASIAEPAPIVPTPLAAPAGQEATPEPEFVPPPLPERQEERVSPLWAIPLMALILAIWFWWHRRQRVAHTGDNVLWAYDRLLQAARRLGHPTPPSQTPAEFQSTFLAHLEPMARYGRLAPLLQELRPGVERLTSLFVARQYSRLAETRRPQTEARAIWRHLAPRLRLLALFNALLERIRRQP